MTWEHIFWIFVPSRILKPWQTHGFPGSVLAKLPGDSSSWWKELDGFFDPGHSGPGIAAMLEGTVVGSPWRTWRFKLFHGEQIWQRFFEPVWLGNKSTYVVFFCTFTPFFGFTSFFKWNSSLRSISLGFHTHSTWRVMTCMTGPKERTIQTPFTSGGMTGRLGKDKKLKNVSMFQHLQRDAKWFRYRVSIHHPLGFNWHPFEGPGRCWFMFFFLPLPRSKSHSRFQWCQSCLTCVWRNLGTFWCFFRDF